MAHRTTQQIITRHNTLKEDAINAIWEWLKHYQFNELVVFEEQAQQLKDENNHLTFHGIHHHGSESTIDVICYDGSKEQFSVHIFQFGNRRFNLALNAI